MIFLPPAESTGRLVLIYISPEQATWTAPLWWHMPPGQGTLGQTQSSGSSPSHLNSSAQTWPSDSLKGMCFRTDTALPHPSSAQMTWAVGSVKFPSDTGIHSFPECTSTLPEQGLSPPNRRTDPKIKNNDKHSERSFSLLANWKQYVTGNGVKTFQELSTNWEFNS